MSDQSYKRILRRYKHTKRRAPWPRLNPLSRLITANSFGHWNNVERYTCSLHPGARYITCNHPRRSSYYSGTRHNIWKPKGRRYGLWSTQHTFCSACFGNTCPDCGKQVSVKQRHKSRGTP